MFSTAFKEPRFTPPRKKKSYLGFYYLTISRTGTEILNSQVNHEELIQLAIHSANLNPQVEIWKD